MKKIYILLFSLFFNSMCYTQYITPMTLNIAGFSADKNGFGLTISTGESISIADFNTQSKYSLNSGFLQNFTPIITGIFDNAEVLGKNDILVSPNPTTGLANFTTNAVFFGQLQYQILDASSRLLFTSDLIKSNERFSRKLDLLNFPQGVYYLKIYLRGNGSNIKTGIYKIIKL